MNLRKLSKDTCWDNNRSASILITSIDSLLYSFGVEGFAVAYGAKIFDVKGLALTYHTRNRKTNVRNGYWKIFMCSDLNILSNFHTHTAVVIGAFPKAGFIAVPIDCSIGIYAPKPFAMLTIDEVLLNVLPTS